VQPARGRRHRETRPGPGAKRIAVLPRRPSAVADLRAATRPLHDRVDVAFSGFDLGDWDSYGRFLITHARATMGAEACLESYPGLPQWRPRTELLLHDLAVLGLRAPRPVALGLPINPAARWGVLYVLEGSRLGGAVLLRRTPPQFPRMFLSARHDGAEWRNLLTAIENEAGTASDWAAGLEEGARACFELYIQSAIDPAPAQPTAAECAQAGGEMK
jgi:heme oxygenase